ncbi:MAG: TetR/AcrR family transcriptional regulator; helix-turn-helix transcriptional regulator [Treponema sp.]|jgi:AcrR family transcriptional regulator|nr:TetR/AcrR family transcriptional regulator; helix-turn-helix transcriptional regulator [Treponema sp.]
MESSAHTKVIILDKALNLFSRKGYASVGIQEIVTEAGITKPTLYYYFKSKQGLLEAIIAEHGAELLRITRKAAEYRHDIGMNLTAILRETISFAHRDTSFYRLGMSLFSAAPETAGYAPGHRLRRELVALLERLFIAAAEDHAPLRNREKVYAETFRGLIETWAALSIDGAVQREIQIDAYLQYRIIHQYLYGIFS